MSCINADLYIRMGSRIMLFTAYDPATNRRVNNILDYLFTTNRRVNKCRGIMRVHGFRSD